MLWEILKASKGILVADFYADLWANIAGGGTPVDVFVEMIGTLPLYYNGKGIDLADYLISGNALQDGTPTPDAPVDATGCGVRTGNVMPAGEKKTVEVNGVTFSSDGNGRYRISGTATEFASVRFDLLSGFTAPISVSNGGQGTVSFFNTQSNNQVTLRFYNGTILVDSWKQTPIRKKTTAYNTLGNKYIDNVVITVSSGATVDITIAPEFTDDGVLPSEFEPYGYKLPLTVNGVEYPIYIGTVPTTRRVKKLVLTGEENWKRWATIASSTTERFYTNMSGVDHVRGLCSHFPFADDSRDTPHFRYGGTSFNELLFWIDKQDASTVDDFKQYLATQYANGTPVTVWYVLAEPETGIVNEPLMKNGDYADTVSFAQAGVTIPTVSGANVLDMTSPVKPSEVYIKGKGIKPTGYGQLGDVNNVNILDKDGTTILVHGQ